MNQPTQNTNTSTLHARKPVVANLKHVRSGIWQPKKKQLKLIHIFYTDAGHNSEVN
jgi:hypothetical protein